MGKVFKVVALLLMMTLGVSVVQAQLLTVQARPVESPGGCHQHGGKTPSPASYQCCLTGHNVAILQSSHAAEPFHFTQSEPAGEDSSSVFSAVPSDQISVPAAGPPGSSPLRI